MRLTKLLNRFVFLCDLSDNEAPRQAGFVWDEKEGYWYTEHKGTAAKLGVYADTHALQSLGSLIEEYRRELEASWADAPAADAPPLIAPEGQSYLPYQAAGIHYALKRRGVLIADEPGLGKAQPLHSPVMTPTGWRTMGELKVGDKVMGSQGKPIKVTGVYDQGRKLTYKLTFHDGSSAVCCGEHLWQIVVDELGNGEVVDTDTLRARLAAGESIYLPDLQALEFAEQEHVVHPYLLGCLLGKGSMMQRVYITLKEDAKLIVDKIRHQLPEGQSLLHRQATSRYDLPAGPIPRALYEMGLGNTKARERFIPKEYLIDSIQNRKRLLRGLVDSSGHVVRQKQLYFYTGSEQLANDIMELVRGLGGFSRKVKNQAVWRVLIHLTNEHGRYLFSSVDKQLDYQPVHTRRHMRKLESVEAYKTFECRCIRVDSYDHLYVTQDYLLTHNTIQAWGWVNNHPDIQPGDQILICCPATLKINWYREGLKWLTKDFTMGIVKDHVKDREGNVIDNGWPDAQIVICNYDRLEKYEHEIATMNFKAVILDEAHLLKGDKEKVKRCAMVYNYLKPKYRMMLTGTPIVNYPIEIFHMIAWLNDQLFGSYYSFASRYCERSRGKYGVETTGGRNLDELQEKLRLNLMVRRLKKNVLKDLPQKMRQVIEIPAEKTAGKAVKDETKFMEANADFLNKFYDIIAKTPSHASQGQYEAAIEELKAAEPAKFNELAKLRQATAEKKVKLIVQYAKELIEGDPDKKVIIYAHHKSVVDGIMAGLGAKAVKVDGRTSEKERQVSVDRFQTDKKIRYIIISMAGAVGITLTAGDHVLFAELDWVPANMQQIEDRAHRIGQKMSVLVQLLVLEGSIDARMAKALVRKMQLIDQSLDKPIANWQRAAAVTKQEVKQQTSEFSLEQNRAILRALRFLAHRCDGAQTVDNQGFSERDANFGKSLAKSKLLSDKQLPYGLKLVEKYHNQLPAEWIKEAQGIALSSLEE